MLDVELPEKWRWVTLGEVADPAGRAIVSGPFGSNIGSRFFVEEGVPVIRGNNLTADMRRFVDDGFVFVTEEKAAELRNCQAVRDDLVFTAAGTLGQVGIIPQESRFEMYIISNKQMRARVNKGIVDPLFAFYWFSSPPMVEYVQQRNTGSSVPLINLGVLRSLPFPLPPLTEQRAIASVLGSLDDKIELNRRMNETLEALAQSLFKSWFVDATQSALPKGWHEATLGEIAENASNTFDFSQASDVFFVNTGDVLCGDFLHSKRSSKIGLPGQAKKAIRQNDILFSEIRPGNRRYAYVDFDPIGYVVSTKFMVIRASEKIEPRILYQVLTSAEALQEFQIEAESRSGTFPQITFDSISRFKIILPPIEFQRKFVGQVAPLDKRIKANKKESRMLAALRDALLPKLLSGELRVKEAYA